ncbi:hypothetical protein HK096_004641, partial [Nowakowskiella sp. JEL0078]
MPEPGITSYRYLLQTYVSQKNMKQAFNFYRKMRNIAVNSPWLHPDLELYKILIRGCIENNEVARGWSFFDFMRTEITKPDAELFTIMIRSCALTKNAERGLDLFREMLERGLRPDVHTYDALILACGSRDDFYEECFIIFQQMVSEKILPNHDVYKNLLVIVAKRGDIERAKFIWNAFIENFKENPQKIPKTNIWALMIECYSMAIEKQKKRIPKLPETKQLLLEATKQPVQILPSPITNLNDVVSVANILSIPTVPLNSANLIRQVDGIWNSYKSLLYLSSLSPDSPASKLILSSLKVNTAIVNRYLRVQCARIRNGGNPNYAMELFKSYQDVYGVQYNNNSWKTILRTITKRDEFMQEYGKELWNQFLQWDAEMEEKMINEFSEKQYLLSDYSRPKPKLPKKQEIDQRRLHWDYQETSTIPMNPTENQINTVESLFDEISETTVSDILSPSSEHGQQEIEEISSEMEEHITEIDIKSKNITLLKPMPLKSEKEELRIAQGRGEKQMFQIFTWMIQGYTRFREYGYLRQFHFKHIWNLLEKCYNLAENGDVGPARRLVDLCPVPPAGAYESGIINSVQTPGPGRFSTGSHISTPLALADAKLYEVEKMIKDQWGSFGGRR